MSQKMKLYILLLVILFQKSNSKSFIGGDFECPGNGIFPDPDNCQCFYQCANLTPFLECCGEGTYFDEEKWDCDYADHVDCGDRPEPGSTRPPSTTSEYSSTAQPTDAPTSTEYPTTLEPTSPPTTEFPTTEGPTDFSTTNAPTTEGPTDFSTTNAPTTSKPTEGPTTQRPTESPTSANPDGPGFPKKVLGLYILLADDFEAGFESNADWEPKLYEYQQLGANVLFFTFINPATMEVPLAFKKLAATRGTGAEGAVPSDTIIIFAIGGYAYSLDPNPWEWLTSRDKAEAMAEEVATWRDLYGIDGIDMDIEEGAGAQKEAGPNLLHFIHKLKSLQPGMIVSQPTYGYPQVAAEIDVINGGWSPSANRDGEADSVGLMVYEGTQALQYVKNYAEGTSQWEGFPIKVDVPRSDILLGCKGSSSSGTIGQLAEASINDNILGIMVWYASVIDGLKYQVTWDASGSMNSQEGFVEAMELFKQNM